MIKKPSTASRVQRNAAVRDRTSSPHVRMFIVVSHSLRVAISLTTILVVTYGVERRASANVVPPDAPAVAPVDALQAAPGAAAKHDDKDKDDADDKGSPSPEKPIDETSFPLLRHGIVVGAGLALHVPGGHGPTVHDVDSTPFLYAGYMFNFWSDSEAETNAYCASFQSEAALERADATAIARTAAMDLHDAVDAHDAKAIERAKALAKKTPPDLSAADRKHVEDRRKWQMGVRAQCGLARHLGLFVALPAKFSADVDAKDGGTPMAADITPVFTVGGIIALTPYVHVLLGYTSSHAARTQKIMDVDRTTNDSVGTYFIGVGTTFDAIGGVLTGK